MLRGSVLIFAANLYQKVIALVIQALLYRILGNEVGVSIYALLILIGTYVTTLATIGLGPAHVYFRGSERMDNRQMQGNSLIATAILGAAAVVIFTVLRFSVLGPFLKLDSVDSVLLTLITVAFPIYILQNFVDFGFQAENRLGTYSAMFAFRYVTLPIFLVAALFSPDPYIGIAVALLVNAALTLLVSSTVFVRLYGFRPEFSLRLFRSESGYGVKVFAGSVFTQLGLRLDYFLVNYLVSTARVAPYNTATNLAESIWLVPSAVASAILPRIAMSKTAASAGEVTARTCRISFALSIGAAAVLFVAAAPIIWYIFGPDAMPGVVPLRVLLIGTVGFSLQKVLVQYFIGQGHTAWFQRATIISVVVNIALNLWLLPKPEWGITGAAVASAVSYTVSAGILAFLFLRWSGLGVRDLLVPNREDVNYLLLQVGQIRRRKLAGR